MDKPRMAKIYVTDIRVNDRISKQRNGPVWRVVKKTWVNAGQYQIVCTDGPTDYTWTSRSDTSTVWIEVP
jgi:ribosomal protein S4E